MSSSSQITCPNCKTPIDVNDVLSHQLEEQIRLKYQAENVRAQKLLEEKEAQLNSEREKLAETKKRENELFQERLEAQIKKDRLELEEKLKNKLNQENAEAFTQLQKELNEKSAKISEMNQLQIEMERLKREKEELAGQIQVQFEKKMNDQLRLEAEKIRKQEEERNELRLRELQKQLEDQKTLTEEMKRKQEQGSMQLQGEVQELAIEEWLMSKFPLDTIEEISKGARGGDCIQRVHTQTQQNCGTIYYESKRTKDFQPSWIEKFKQDMRSKNISVGVLVTEAYPKGMERMEMRDGIWICSYDEFKGLSAVLRQAVIDIHNSKAAEENKGDKMHLLYNYLTSSTFRMQVEAIVEGFRSLKDDLESEKRSMQRIWKQREKQIEKVMENTIDMYGSVRGIAGNAIQSVKALELGNDLELDSENE